MNNPIFNMLGGNKNMQNMIAQFNQFKNSFSGDPRQQVQQLLNSGRITQAQYDQAVQIANSLQQILK